MLTAARSGREEQFVAVSGGQSVSETQPVQTVDLKGRSRRQAERAEQGPGLEVERLDLPVAPVGHEQATRIIAESCGRQRDTPGRVERLPYDELLLQHAVEIKKGQRAVAGSGHRILAQ